MNCPSIDWKINEVIKTNPIFCQCLPFEFHSNLELHIFPFVFQKEKTTTEKLEELEEKINDIESFAISTQARQKRFVGNFLVFSVGLYVIASVVFYFVFFPSTWSKRIVYSTPLLIFPVL